MNWKTIQLMGGMSVVSQVTPLQDAANVGDLVWCIAWLAVAYFVVSNALDS